MSTSRAANILTGLLAATPLMALAQGVPGTAPELAAVAKADTAYWNAYNQCDYPTLDKYTAQDVEFYHDIGGVTLGRAQLTDSVRKNICGNPQRKVRREAVAANVRTALLKQGDKVYGAVITGEHRFFYNSQPKPTDQARFTMLWLRTNDSWQLKRVLSYDHAPVPYVNERVAATLSAADLDRLTGAYAGKLQPLFAIVRAGANLSVDVNGKPMTLYPLDKNTFFVKEQDITVQFKPASGTAQSFVVRMQGSPVDEPRRQ